VGGLAEATGSLGGAADEGSLAAAEGRSPLGASIAADAELAATSRAARVGKATAGGVARLASTTATGGKSCASAARERARCTRNKPKHAAIANNPSNSPRGTPADFTGSGGLPDASCLRAASALAAVSDAGATDTPGAVEGLRCGPGATEGERCPPD
jgi:hypothetical protein